VSRLRSTTVPGATVAILSITRDGGSVRPRAVTYPLQGEIGKELTLKAGTDGMRCVECESGAVIERPERTAQGYCRFRCRACGKQCNERTGTVLNWTQYPSDVVALVVLWRLRYKLSLRDLPEMFALRSMVFSYEAVREWEAKLMSALAEELRRVRCGKVGGPGMLMKPGYCR
jgi:transposase-like protein